METTKTRRKAEALLVAVFVLGLLLGAVAAHVWCRHRLMEKKAGPPTAHQVVSHLTHELQLTPEQQTQLAKIVDNTRAKWQALYAPLAPQHEQIRQEGRDEIRAILTPEQRAKFDAFIRQLDEQHKKQPQ